MDQDQPAPPETAPAPPRVLLVQPNRNYLGVLARRVSEGGYRVATADGTQAAMAELNRLPVDLVLADLHVPGGGAELVTMIRDDAVLRDLPVILIAGRSDSSAAVKAFAAGADGVVLKPFHFEVLIARIGRELERARSVASLRGDNATLDARVVSRAIELGEMKERWLAAEAERRRLEGIIGKGAA